MRLSERADVQRRIERSGRRLSVAAGQQQAFTDPRRVVVQTWAKVGR